jgi:hypothetical protein
MSKPSPGRGGSTPSSIAAVAGAEEFSFTTVIVEFILDIQYQPIADGA